MPENLITADVPVARIVRIVVLTVLSGLADPHGFVRTARAFQHSDIISADLAQAVIFFGLGLITYFFAVRELMVLGIDAPEIHMLFWFGVTIVGLAVLSGRVSSWPGVDQVVGGLVVLGICWLIFRVD